MTMIAKSSISYEIVIVIVGASGMLLFIELMNQKTTYLPTRDIDIRVTEGTVTQELKAVLQEYEIEIVEGVIQFPLREDFKEKGV